MGRVIQMVVCRLCGQSLPKREAHKSYVAGKGPFYTCHACTPWMK